MSQGKYSRPFVVGIIGHAKAGKDTLFDYLVHAMDYDPRINGMFKVAVADGIKEVTFALGFDWEHIHDQKYKEEVNPVLGFSARTAMQDVGRMFRDKYGEDFWLKRLENKIDSKFNSLNIVFVTDIRLPVEAEFIRERFDCMFIKVERPSLDLSLPMYQHDTEIYVDAIKLGERDLTFTNDCNFDEFKVRSHEVGMHIIEQYVTSGHNNTLL